MALMLSKKKSASLNLPDMPKTEATATRFTGANASNGTCCKIDTPFTTIHSKMSASGSATYHYYVMNNDGTIDDSTFTGSQTTWITHTIDGSKAVAFGIYVTGSYGASTYTDFYLD